MELRKLLIRTLSGLIYCLIMVGALFLGPWGVATLAALLAVLAIVEFTKISHPQEKSDLFILSTDILAGITLCYTPMAWLLGFLWILLMMFRFIQSLYIQNEHPVKNLAYSVLSQIWIVLPLALMSFIGWAWNPMAILPVFLLIWINDTGAFLVGSSIGKHRLFERISPKKSWEGFVGGLLFSVGFAVLFCFVSGKIFPLEPLRNNYWLWTGLGIIVSIFGTWGDLVESMIKRTMHIKDSGNLIPGHGGILDRIDSLLMVITATFVYYSSILILGV